MEFTRRTLVASALTWETRAGGVLAKTGHKVAFLCVAHAEDTCGERLFDPKPLNLETLKHSKP